MDTLAQAQNLFKYSQKYRRDLHQHPELSFKESNTSTYCKKIMQDLGFDVRACWQHGFVADWVFNPNEPFIAWRADMDALPILELNQHDFVSQNKGVAHMCGHDSHMATALTAARLVANNKDQWQGPNVRFIFQPAEETPPGGALGMIDNQCLDQVAAVYGLHNNPEYPTGQVVTRAGGLFAAADIFELVITGSSGHAAKPHEVLDPVYVAAQLITQWQSFVARKLNPANPAVLSVTKCQAGNTYNVIPDQAIIAGTVRTYNNNDRKIIRDNLRATLAPYEQQGYQCELNYTQGYDPVINHADAVNRIGECASKFLNENQIDINCEPTGYGEDFCYYLQHVPGAYFMLGSGNTDQGITEPLHSSRFDVDEKYMSIGAAIAFELLSTSP